MIKINIPTSKDIYIEINGKKLAVVEGYKARSVRESRLVEAFGETDAVCAIPGKTQHYLVLSKVYINTDSSEGDIDFHNLSNFNVVIVKPNKRIVYSGCEWSEINESAGVNDTIIEGMSLISSNRMEMANS